MVTRPHLNKYYNKPLLLRPVTCSCRNVHQGVVNNRDIFLNTCQYKVSVVTESNCNPCYKAFEMACDRWLSKFLLSFELEGVGRLA